MRRWPFALCAVGLPLLLAWLTRELGHDGDIAYFREWCAALREGFGDVYRASGANYPIGGVLLACGPTALLPELPSMGTYRLVLKGTIAVGEVLLVFGLDALARALDLRVPKWARVSGFEASGVWALGVYLVPTSWIGGAWFGQLDPWGSALLVWCAAFFVRYRRSGHELELGRGVLCLALAVLTKQLVVFSFLGLGWIALDGVRRHGPEPRRVGRWVIAAVLLLVVADPFLRLPDGWWLHVPYTYLSGGARAGDLLSANGANLWVLLMSHPDDAADAFVVLGLSARVLGWIGFALTQALALWWLWRAREAWEGLVAAGYANLAMAVLLTGVHERYLVHGVPLLLLGLARAPRWLAIAAWVVSIWAGFFVLSSIHWRWLGAVDPLRSHTWLAWLQIALLVATSGWMLRRAGRGS